MNETPTRKLVRSRSDRVIGGVAAGLAEHLKIDPLIVRVAFAVSLAFGGLGILLYLLLLVILPVAGDPGEPLPPISPTRKKVAVASVLGAGALVLFAIGTDGFARWFFGFAPGTLFGILFWCAVAALAVWALATGLFRQGDGTTGNDGSAGVHDRREEGDRSVAGDGPAKEDGSREDDGPATSDVSERVAVFAESPTQLDQTEVMAVRAHGPDRPAAGGGATATAGGSGEDAPSVIGRIMTWFAVGVTGLAIFVILFATSAGVTVIAGGIPTAVLAIALGAGIVLTAVRGRGITAGLLLAAAIAVVIPMMIVTLGDLRIKGSYGEVRKQPRSAADIPADGYRMAAGNLTVDLRWFNFNRRRVLDLPIRSGVGLTSVIVPDRVCVGGEVFGKAGIINLRGLEQPGVNVMLATPVPGSGPAPGSGSASGSTSGPTPASGAAPRADLHATPPPTVRLDGEFKLGAFEVVDDTLWRRVGGGGSFDPESSPRARAQRKRAAAACSARSGGKRQAGSGKPRADTPEKGRN